MNTDFPNASETFRRLNPHLVGLSADVAPVSKGPPPLTNEAELHYAILDYCRSRGYYVSHGSMAHRTHRTEGEPDFIIAMPGGRTLWLECKRPGGKLTPAQLCVMAQLIKLGHYHKVVTSMDEFFTIL